MTHVDCAMQRVIEPLNQLDRRTLAAPTRANEGNVGAGFHGEVESAQDANTGAGRVPEVHVLEADAPMNLCWNLAVRRTRVNRWLIVEEVDDVRG